MFRANLWHEYYFPLFAESKQEAQWGEEGRTLLRGLGVPRPSPSPPPHTALEGRGVFRLRASGSMQAPERRVLFAFVLIIECARATRLPKGRRLSAHPFCKHLKGMWNIRACISEGTALQSIIPSKLVDGGEAPRPTVTEPRGDLQRSKMICGDLQCPKQDEW